MDCAFVWFIINPMVRYKKRYSTVRIMNKHFIPQELYHQIVTHVPILCVDVAIRHNGKLLLVKRKQPPLKDVWWVVGGRVCVGEKLADAARRKLKEEINLVADKLTQAGAHETMFDEIEFDGGVHAPHTVNILFVADVSDISAIRLDASISEYKLFDSLDKKWHSVLQQMVEDCKLFK